MTQQKVEQNNDGVQLSEIQFDMQEAEPNRVNYEGRRTLTAYYEGKRRSLTMCIMKGGGA